MRLYTDIVDVADAALAGDELAQHGLDLLLAASGEVLAGQDPFRQRLDMAFHLDIMAELAADGGFENRRFLMRLFQRHLAVDLEIEADRSADADALDGQMMDGEALVLSDEAHALRDRFIIERDRIGGDGDIGIGIVRP